MLASVELRPVVFYNHTILQFSAFDLIKLLCLHDVLQTTLVAMRLEFLQQMQFVLLQFLNALIQSGDRSKHFIVALLIIGDFLLGVFDSLSHVADLVLCILQMLSRIVKMGFHV